MDTYFEQYGDLYCKQLELELAYKTEAEELLKASLDQAVADGEAAQTKIGGKLIDYAYDTVASNMATLLESVKHPKSGVVPNYAPYLKQCLTIYSDQEDKLLALLSVASLGTLISNILSNRNSISSLAMSLCQEIEHEARVEAFFKYKAEKEGRRDTALIKNFDEGLKKRIQHSYKVAYAVDRMNKEGFAWAKWPQKEALILGAKLLEMAVKGSGYFEEGTDTAGIASIYPKQWLRDTWAKNAALLSKVAYKYCPTIIPPKPWTDPDTGGYYGELTKFVSLLRLYGGQPCNFTVGYKQRLHQVDLSYIYKALNAMQSTPFIINKKVLEVGERIRASGGGLGLPRTEPIPQLPQLTGDFTEEALKEHKRKMVGIIKRNQARTSKALRATMVLSTARKFAEYERIFFPWNMDYRGRCYPVPSSLSPQGDDLTKALLLFAEPHKCKSAEDYKWLAIHGANLAGHDKIPFEARITWVQEHTHEILSSAQDPLGFTWWHEESKGDYPLEFLAFCFEWERYQTWLKDHKDCVGFASGLPLAFDGTCSGLQHFSALLRDEVGGAAVNLVPSDQVQDIYAIVADKVNKVLTNDAAAGTLDDYKRDKEGAYLFYKKEDEGDEEGEKIPQLGTKTLAQQWLLYARKKYGKDGITRKVVKRSVMTLAYGSKKFGFKNNILEDIIKPFALEYPEDHPFFLKEQAAMYMADLIWTAVSTTVIKAVKGMDYLQKIAGLITKNSQVVTWVTPNGLPVQQNYFKVEQKLFQMRFNGTKKNFYTQENTFVINKTAQKNAISPNFIHAMDACHLQRVVVSSSVQGNTNLAMVHDSFGTDMAAAGDLYKIIRQEFVGLYDNVDHLKKFVEDVEYLMDEEALLPDRPDFGVLKIADIVNSQFCFA